MDNKKLSELLCERLGVSDETVASLTDGFVKSLGECGSELDSVAIPQFGTFEPKRRMERVALHPANGKRLLIPPKIVLTFKPSANLKSKINGK